MRKNIVRTVIMTTLALGVASGLLVSPTDSLGAEPSKPPVVQEVSLRDIDRPLVPTARVGSGDREFGGNGPRIECKVKLRVSDDKRAIMADIMFHAKETKPDYSEVRQTWKRKVYDAPAGKHIVGIVGPAESEVSFTSRKAGFQLLGPGEDFQQFVQKLEELVNMVLDAERKLSNRPKDSPEARDARALMEQLTSGVAALHFQGNDVHTVAPTTKGPVGVFAIVGDTGGDDISDDEDGKDDTRIVAIKFNKVRVKLSD